MCETLGSIPHKIEPEKTKHKTTTTKTQAGHSGIANSPGTQKDEDSKCKASRGLHNKLPWLSKKAQYNLPRLMAGGAGLMAQQGKLGDESLVNTNHDAHD